MNLKTKLVSGTVLGTLLFTAAVPVFGETTAVSAPSAAIDSVCMANAVTTRDTAVVAAVDAYHTAIVNALNVRKDALVAAWKLTGKERRTAIRTAWSNYNKIVKEARKTFKNGKRAAWDGFYKDRKSCGKGAASEDATTHGVDEQL